MVKLNNGYNVTKKGVVRKNPPKADFYEKVILDGISTDGYNVVAKTPKAKFKFLKERFVSEYDYMIKRVGIQKAMAEWYQGLAIDIPYYNQDIIKLAKKAGGLPENATERQEQNILDNYWNFMAFQTLKAFKKYKV